MDLAIHAAKHAAAGSGAAVGAEAESAGMLLGMAVTEVKSPQSILAEAAEEMSFILHEHGMEQEADLEERAEEHKNEERHERLKKYHEIMERNSGKVHRLEAMQDYLSSRQERRDATREMMRFFTNPADLFAALGYILGMFEEEGPTKAVQAANVRRLMDDLEDEHGPQIYATIIGTLQAEGCENLGTYESLSELYTNTVCNFAGVKEVFTFISEEYGEKGFDSAMDYMFKAISADLASDRPSMGVKHLESVHTNLDKVRLLQNAFLQCDQLLCRWEREYGITAAPQTLPPLRLAGRVLDLNDMNYLGAMHIEELASEIKPRDPEQAVLLLQDLLGVIRTLPIRLFGDEQGRMKVLVATQQAVDKAIEHEDSWLIGGSDD